jgi:hypothetical protein
MIVPFCQDIVGLRRYTDWQRKAHLWQAQKPVTRNWTYDLRLRRSESFRSQHQRLAALLANLSSKALSFEPRKCFRIGSGSGWTLDNGRHFNPLSTRRRARCREWQNSFENRVFLIATLNERSAPHRKVTAQAQS